VNAGTDADVEVSPRAELPVALSCTETANAEIAVDGVGGAKTAALDSRAGAAALAAPEELTGEAAELILGAELCAPGFAADEAAAEEETTGGARITSSSSRISASFSALSTGAEATTLGGAAGL
jgi:hypothetical protein